MSKHEPINVPPGVMRVLHQLEASAYHPEHNERAGDDYRWANDPVPAAAGRWSQRLGNLAFVCAILLATMMLGGFALALAEGRVH